MICDGKDRTGTISHVANNQGPGSPTHPDLFPLAGIACLHEPHEMSMLTLLLRLRASTRRASHIDSVLGHDGEAGQSEFGGFLRFGPGLLCDSRGPASTGRGHADGAVAGVAQGGRRGRTRSEDGRREAGGLGLGRALLEGLVRPWKDFISSDQGTGVEVDGSVVEEINCYYRELVLLGGGTRDVRVDQLLELLGTQSRLESKRRTQERLGDGERRRETGGSHRE